LDSAPPALSPAILVAIIPALLAAIFAATSWSIGALSDARRSAVREALTGGARRALDRYEEHGGSIEARWLVIRALGISLTALLIGRYLPPFDGWMPAVAALATLLVYGIPAEITRILALRNPERSAPLLLRLVAPIELLFVPLAAPVVWIGRLFEHEAESRPTPTPGLVESEVQMLVTEGELSGSLGHEQSEMIRNVLDFAAITAGELMVPRTQVHAIELDTPIAEVLALIAESEHSRYPVYRENIDNVVGVLHAKDLLPHLSRGDLEKVGLPALVRQPVVFVPESQPADSVLREMRAGKQHLAVVLDEFGGTSGILTLENLLEQIVGDIRDEHDVEEPPIADLGDGRLLVDASVSIADLSRYLGADLPTDGDYHTLAGFIVAELGTVPEAGVRITAFELDFEVKEADERRVLKVEITRRTPPAESVLPRSSSRIPVAS
jgi:CBS domain containing-hemolysin-like protein